MTSFSLYMVCTTTMIFGYIRYGSVRRNKILYACVYCAMCVCISNMCVSVSMWLVAARVFSYCVFVFNGCECVFLKKNTNTRTHTHTRRCNFTYDEHTVNNDNTVRQIYVNCYLFEHLYDRLDAEFCIFKYYLRLCQ